MQSGSVTVNGDGSLTLNGTIIQILESPAGENVTACASAGQASYNDSTRTFSITAEDELITWAKLERGDCGTPFAPPVYSLEKLECMRFFQRHGRGYDGFHSERTLVCDTGRITAIFSLDIPMRAVPTTVISGDGLVFRRYNNGSVNANFTNAVWTVTMTNNIIYGIIVASPDITAGAYDGYIGYGAAGYVDFDAEIYPQ